MTHDDPTRHDALHTPAPDGILAPAAPLSPAARARRDHIRADIRRSIIRRNRRITTARIAAAALVLLTLSLAFQQLVLKPQRPAHSPIAQHPTPPVPPTPHNSPTLPSPHHAGPEPRALASADPAPRPPAGSSLVLTNLRFEIVRADPQRTASQVAQPNPAHLAAMIVRADSPTATTVTLLDDAALLHAFADADIPAAIVRSADRTRVVMPQPRFD